MSTATSASDVSTRVAERMAEAVGPRKYAMWFERAAQFACLDDHTLQVSVPNRFVADWIGKNFEGHLHTAASCEMGEQVQVQVQVAPERFGSATAAPAPAPGVTPSVHAPAETGATPTPTPKPTTQRRPMPRLRHRLDDFVIGASNELAHAAAGALTEDRPDTPRTVFLHGGCGLGKTHLLQGVCARMLERDPGAAVLYTTGEQFTNDYITAVRTNKLDAFRRRVRNLDLLAVDDVHFIANKQATQQEFLHSFDQIELGGAKVILASDCHPRHIRQFSEALVSRCVRGLVVQIHRPDPQTRLRLVTALAERRGLRLQAGVADELAARSEGSVREIEGMLTKLQALAWLGGGLGGGGAVGHALVRRLFQGEGASLQARKPVRFEMILQTVAGELGVTPPQVLGRGRTRPVVLARAMTIHLARELTSMSYPEIAAAMKRGNHSTVITAAQRVQKQIDAAELLLLPGPGNTNARELVDRLREAVRLAA